MVAIKTRIKTRKRRKVEFSELKSIEFYIKPGSSEKPVINQKPSFNLTDQSSQTLKDAAAVTSDPKLKEVFNKLARSINKKPSP